MPENNFERIPAAKIDVVSLKSGKFVEKKGEWEPNYIKTDLGFISRVNIIGILVSKNMANSSIVIDDGTGSISANISFANNSQILKFQDMKEGQGVIVIGRPRKFDDDIYITAEIVNTINNLRWIQFRKMELEKHREEGFFIHMKDETYDSTETASDIKEDIDENKTEDHSNIGQDSEEMKDIYEITNEIIEKNDQGDGVSSEIIEREMQRLNVTDPKNSIKRLLEQGDIFEIAPGKLKLLK